MRQYFMNSILSSLLVIACGLLQGCVNLQSQTTQPLPQTLQRAWARENAVLHIAPHASSQIIRSIPPRTLLDISALHNSWSFVTVRDQLGGHGWIATPYMSRLPPGNVPVVARQTHVAPPQTPAPQPEPSAEEKTAWNMASHLNTIPSYLEYIDKYMTRHESSCIPEAIEKIDDAVWLATRNEDTFESYVKYLEFFPNGENAAQARTRLPSLLSTKHQPLPPFWDDFKDLQGIDFSAIKDGFLELRQEGKYAVCPPPVVG